MWQVTIFERHEEGPVAIKFKEAAHAEECNGLMNGRFFGGRKLSCDFWDGTNYVVKVWPAALLCMLYARDVSSGWQETAEEEAKRLESFGDWLEASKSDAEMGSGQSASDSDDSD